MFNSGQAAGLTFSLQNAALFQVVKRSYPICSELPDLLIVDVRITWCVALICKQPWNLMRSGVFLQVPQNAKYLWAKTYIIEKYFCKYEDCKTSCYGNWLPMPGIMPANLRTIYREAWLRVCIVTWFSKRLCLGIASACCPNSHSFQLGQSIFVLRVVKWCFSYAFKF